MPVPFHKKQFMFTQPDGTNLRVLGYGNQHYARFETLNGYTVAQDPTSKFYVYVDVDADGDEFVSTGARPRLTSPRTLGLRPGLRLSGAASRAKAFEASALPRGNSRWEVRRREAKAAAPLTTGILGAPPQRKTVGTFIGLCLLIDFPDELHTITDLQVRDFCNAPGYADFGNAGSVRDYFLDTSRQKFDYTNIVAPWYTAKHPRAYYTNESVPQPRRARELIKEALKWHKDQGFNFNGLTADGQGFIYATNVFYAGTRVNNWAKGLWPHAYHLATAFPLAPGRSSFDYQITDITSELSLGTFCHENGHMVCDFPDLYDYGYESAGVGAWSLMCAGPNASEKNPPHVDAYLKFKAGWGTVTQLGGAATHTVEAGRNEFFIHKKPNFPAEYYIVENRYKAGRDAALPGSGLAIWHVDEDGDNQNEQMTAASHYECSLVQADGRNDLENDPSNLGDATDLFANGGNAHFGSATTPRSSWWDGSASGLEIDTISAAGATITFRS